MLTLHGTYGQVICMRPLSRVTHRSNLALGVPFPSELKAGRGPAPLSEALKSPRGPKPTPLAAHKILVISYPTTISARLL